MIYTNLDMINKNNVDIHKSVVQSINLIRAKSNILSYEQKQLKTLPFAV